MTKAKKRPSPSTSIEEATVEDHSRYREHLVAARQMAQGEWDKVTWALAGGALATSLVFLKDIVGNKTPRRPGWLVAGWAMLVASLVCVLVSHALSVRALSKAIDAVDAGRPQPHLNRWRVATECSNGLASILCIGGVLCIVVFTYLNFGA
jgi:hypothetical protein